MMIPHGLVKCRWAYRSVAPSLVVCAKNLCPANSRIDYCRSCPQRDNPDAPMKPPPEMDPEAHFGCKGCGG